MYLGTQQISNFSNEKAKEVGHLVLEEEALDQDDLYYSGEMENVAVNNIVVPEEEKSRKKLFKEKKASVPDAEEEEILEQMKQQKMQRDDPFLHYEGDIDIEEFYEESEDSEPEEQPEEEYFGEKMKQKPAMSGPTTRSHHEPEGSQPYFFVPSNDEDSSP
jgi:hypothetical protein